MKAVKFDQVNLELAKNQPEYETLPVFVETKSVRGPDVGGAMVTHDVPWSMTACFELSEEEIEEIVRTKKIWHKQMLFGNNFQPIFMTTKCPLE